MPSCIPPILILRAIASARIALGSGRGAMLDLDVEAILDENLERTGATEYYRSPGDR